MERFCVTSVRTDRKYHYDFRIKSQKDFDEVVKELTESGLTDYENNFTEYASWAKTYSQHQWCCKIFEVEI